MESLKALRIDVPRTDMGQGGNFFNVFSTALIANKIVIKESYKFSLVLTNHLHKWKKKNRTKAWAKTIFTEGDFP